MTETQTLVLILCIRKAISGTDDVPISDIIATGVLNMVSQILKFADTTEEVKVMKVRDLIS